MGINNYIKFWGVVMRRFIILSLIFLVGLYSLSFVSAEDTSNNDTYVIKVTHDDIKRDSTANFTVNVKNSNGSVASGTNIEVKIRHVNGTYDSFSHADTTDSKGNCYFKWSLGNVEDLGNYEMMVYAYTTDPVYKSAVYKENITLTTNHTLDVKVSKSTVYEGEYTEIRVYSKVDGKKNNIGYIQWTCDGKNYITYFKDGVTSLRYNSAVIGKNSIYLVYIPLNLPGFDDIPVVSKNVTINVKGASDLVISNVVRSGNKYKVTIKNIGNGASSATKLKLWYSAKKYKIINVSSLGAGNSKTYVVNFFKYSIHKNYKKYAQINYNKAAYEKNYTNNKITFKSNVAYGLAADLKITKVTRSGNNYIITIKNTGNVAASAFKLKLWYGSKTKVKGLVSYTITNFDQYGNKLPAGVSITLPIPYYAYKTHSKYYKFVSVNSDKKIIESNYANNIKKFKV